MRRHRRGFTAVELMVAVTAAMIVCAGAYTLAKTSLDVFQQEARMNAAQFSNSMGMNRLTTDIKRAGYMMTPDAFGDPKVCAKPAPPLLDLLFAVNVMEGDGAGTYFGNVASMPNLHPSVTGAGNNRAPDRIRLAGNYVISESFKLGNVDLDGNLISVQVDQLAVQRIFRDAQNGGLGICAYFPNNSLVRLVDTAGASRFVAISACASPANTASPPTNYLTVTLTSLGITTGAGCGELSGGYVNPINIIDYSPVHLTPGNVEVGAALAAVMDQDVAINGIVGDDSRLELVKRQLQINGALLPNTTEIVADYVVDLNFSGRVANLPLTPHVLTSIDFAGAIGSLPTTQKNRVRSLGVRLSTRARNPDRDAGQVPVPTKDQALQRFRVFETTATNRVQWARVRTFFSEVNVTNLSGVVPW